MEMDVEDVVDVVVTEEVTAGAITEDSLVAVTTLITDVNLLTYFFKI